MRKDDCFSGHMELEKSILNLIPRFYDVQKGDIKLIINLFIIPNIFLKRKYF